MDPMQIMAAVFAFLQLLGLADKAVKPAPPTAVVATPDAGDDTQ